ncbi:low molecular weight phosphatase family protein [Cellulosimicrobium terreum]|nr:low molecular weight phosphatase family protein [Cellulosimicrobium terreum]
MPSQVLVVCTGNVCRSPVAQRLLDLRSDASVAVSSAGTQALVGEPVDPPMVALLRGRGFDPSPGLARQLTAEMIEEADLVLTMTREHRADVVTLVPRAVRRTYTLLELAALLREVEVTPDPEEADADRLARVHELASAQRARTITTSTPLDVTDPYRRPERVYRRAFDTIATSVDTIARVVHPPAARRLEWSPTVPGQGSRTPPFPATSEADPPGPRPGGGSPRHGGRRRLF